MRAKILALALAALLLAGGEVFALTISSDGNRGAANRILTTVYNNSSSALTSGTVVVWDTALSGDTNEGAYVNTTTTADSNLVAGVVVTDSIAASGGLGEICVYGPVYALYANSTDGAADTVGTALGTTTVAGQFGNGTGLGCILQVPADGDTADRARVLIFVDPSPGE